MSEQVALLLLGGDVTCHDARHCPSRRRCRSRSGMPCASIGSRSSTRRRRDAYVFYPRTLAPGTLADDLEWREIDGAASLYTYTVARGRPAPPWAEKLPQLLAVVEWDEGPRFSTELVDVDPTDIRIGMRVTPVFCDVPDADITLLRYRPATERGLSERPDNHV